MVVTVVDNGRGLDAGFDIEQATGLGLSIVRTLLTTELAGTISIDPASPTDPAAAGLPAGGRGTIVTLRVPVGDEQ